MARVMVVDDSMYFRLKLTEMLQELGHEIVCEAGDGGQAAIRYTAYMPDVVTLDISMPKVDGLEGIKKIMAIDPNATIIIVSAMGQKQYVLEAMKLGAKHYIVKPFKKKTLEEILDKVIK